VIQKAVEGGILEIQDVHTCKYRDLPGPGGVWLYLEEPPGI